MGIRVCRRGADGVHGTKEQTSEPCPCSQESECRGQGDVFPELVRGVPEGDPVFGGLEGLAISVVVVCLAVAEEVQPPGTEML